MGRARGHPWPRARSSTDGRTLLALSLITLTCGSCVGADGLHHCRIIQRFRTRPTGPKASSAAVQARVSDIRERRLP